MGIALVTGATAGIGLEFVRQLAARGDDLVLVARDEARLQATAAEIAETYGVDTEVLVADLDVHEQLHAVAQRLRETVRPVDTLVNNAGFGLQRRFLDNPVEDEERMVSVLVNAVMVLSHAAGNAMRERGSGTIINVSSMASFMASGSYSAAKSYVTVLSESMATELKEAGVTVTAVCPGFTRTEFHERMGYQHSSSMPDAMWLKAPDVVAEALDAAERGRVVAVPGVQYKVAAAVMRHLPRSVVRRPSRRKTP